MSQQLPALFVHSANELYGADIVLLNLLTHRDSSRWAPYVVLPDDVPYKGRLSARFQEEDIPYCEMKLAVLRRRYFHPVRIWQYAAYFMWSGARLARIIRSRRIRLVHTNTTAVIPGAVVARLTGRPHVWHSHEMVSSPAVVRRLTARLAPALSDVVVVVSDAVRQHILSDNPTARNIRVIHNGIDVERFAAASGRERVRHELGFSDADVVVCTIARVSRGKGQGYLLDAAARAAREHPELKYLLVGDAFTGQEHLVDELRAHVEELGLQDRVRLEGYRSDAQALLAASDICVLPSTLADSFPTVVLEGMAAGRPVIATNWGGAKEMILEGETGYVVPTDDPEAFAARLGSLASSPDLRRAMGETGLARVRSEFTVERMARDFWALMEEVLAGAPSPGV